MFLLLHVWLAGGSVVVASMIFAVIVWKCYCFKDRRGIVDPLRTASLQEGIAKLHQGSLHHQSDQLDTKRRGNYFVFRRGISTRPLFNWADHPALITDAVENGWSRFGFASYMSSPSRRSSLLGFCAAGDHGRETDTEISWEVSQGSTDFMQKIRLNSISGLKKVNVSNPPLSAASVIRTALPLPGPPLGNSSFPQEAYFEITVLYCHGDDQESVVKSKEGERAKLIQENFNAKANSESLVHTSSSHKIKIEESKLAGRDDCQTTTVMLSVGLTIGGSLPLKLPGSYPGSIGFNSNGSLYLDGMKLVFESEKAEWARIDKVIGCGFDPRQKQVFFTVDGELHHVVHCKSEEYGTPLYPTIAANNDIIVLVNFGQSAFSYGQANVQRTPNPCFIGPLVRSPTLGYEDSKELFSMGRIDSQWWLNRSNTKGSHINGANSQGQVVDLDDESEADLFEIVLDNGSGKSPNVRP